MALPSAQRHALPQPQTPPLHGTLTADGVDARPHLTVAVWPAAADLDRALKDVEREIIKAWEPPLNLEGNPHPLVKLKTARKKMARDASEWAGAGEGVGLS